MVLFIRCSACMNIFCIKMSGMQCVANATGEILSEIEPLYMLRAWLQGPTTSIEVAGGVTNEVYGHGFPQALFS